MFIMEVKSITKVQEIGLHPYYNPSQTFLRTCNCIMISCTESGLVYYGGFPISKKLGGGEFQ